jgi:hypothetical protein
LKKCAYKGKLCGGGELERIRIHPVENVQLKNGWKNEITAALTAVAAIHREGIFNLLGI